MIKYITTGIVGLLTFIGGFNDVDTFKKTIKGYIYPEYYYEYLMNAVNEKVEYKSIDDKKIKFLNGNDIYNILNKEIKTNKYTTALKKKTFKTYMESYYEKNYKVDLEKIQKNVDIDLLNYGNFKNYNSLSDAFKKYKEDVSENASLSFLKFIYK